MFQTLQRPYLSNYQIIIKIKIKDTVRGIFKEDGRIFS